MVAAVYVLCFVTSAGCGWLLLSAHARTRAPLLLWSGLCFVLLAFNEALVIVDVFAIPGTSLLPARTVVALAAVSLMLYGLILSATEEGR